MTFPISCYIIPITSVQATKDGERMILKIDFNSDEAFYLQLCNQIILGIAMETFCEGDPLPSVRSLADQIGINMHTVNKAYSILRQEGFVKLDRRKGAIISLDIDKLQALEELRQNLYVVLARGICKNISRTEVHQLVDEIYNVFSKNSGTQAE